MTTRTLEELFTTVRHDPPITRADFDAALANERAAERIATVLQIRLGLVDVRTGLPVDRDFLERLLNKVAMS